MSNPIGWTDQTWNPVTGCAPTSEGCQNCYAARMAKRLAGRFGYDADESFRVTMHPDKLDAPLHWRKPRHVFVCSMGDLFHEDVSTEYRDQIFAVMSLASRHTFQALTKRPGRMHRYLLDRRAQIATARHDLGRWIESVWTRQQLMVAYGRSVSEWDRLESTWPPSNLWLGVTVENQARADERIPILLDTPAAVRFVSVEPMLGPVDLEWLDGLASLSPDWAGGKGGGTGCPHPLLDWVICGPETGPGARPMDLDWARDLRDQCIEAGVPFWYKGGLLDGVERHQRPLHDPPR